MYQYRTSWKSPQCFDLSTIFCVFYLFTLFPMTSPLRVAIVGSGSWGTAVARRVALNILDGTNASFSGDVLMWVYEEVVDGRKLTEIINTDHMNQKYLPGVLLPTSVIACSDLIETCKDADVLLFVVPHQFIRGVLKQMKGNIKPGSIGVSLIKGLDVGPKGPKLLSKMIKDELSLSRDVAVVMGANVAKEVSRDQFVESTVACPDPHVAAIAAQLLNCHSLHVDICTDVATVEICGALKNVVAMGAGFCDALDMGSSTKAAVLRRGLIEIAEFCRLFAGESFDVSTLLQSCGVADVIASAYGGRNRLCSKEFAEARLRHEAGEAELEEEANHAAAHHGTATAAAAGELVGEAVKTSAAPDSPAAVSLKSDRLRHLWHRIEKETLNGSMMQGLGTCDELMLCLRVKNIIADSDIYGDAGPPPAHAKLIAEANESITNESPLVDHEALSSKFGLFKRIHAIARLGESPKTLFDW